MTGKEGFVVFPFTSAGDDELLPLSLLPLPPPLSLIILRSLSSPFILFHSESHRSRITPPAVPDLIAPPCRRSLLRAPRSCGSGCWGDPWPESSPSPRRCWFAGCLPSSDSSGSRIRRKGGAFVGSPRHGVFVLSAVRGIWLASRVGLVRRVP
jgi:hypothetical protein